MRRLKNLVLFCLFSFCVSMPFYCLGDEISPLPPTKISEMSYEQKLSELTVILNRSAEISELLWTASINKELNYEEQLSLQKNSDQELQKLESQVNEIVTSLGLSLTGNETTGILLSKVELSLIEAKESSARFKALMTEAQTDYKKEVKRKRTWRIIAISVASLFVANEAWEQIFE